MQEVGVFILFSGAVSYLLWQIVKTFRPSTPSCSGCSACGGVEFKDIEKSSTEDSPKG